MRFSDKLVKQVFGIENDLEDVFGVEIETEGSSLPNINNSFWKSEADASLRGESFEYVMKKPRDLKGVSTCLLSLRKAWEAAESQIKNSPNAGVHVHVNCGDLTVKQLYNFMSLYLVVEELLIAQCGPDRVGNLFCLRASDAEYLIEMLGIAARTQNLQILHTDDLRYASMNVKALGDYGSLEFRAWRSDGDLDKIKWWVELLAHLKALARQIDNPAQIVADVSERGSIGFYEFILGDAAEQIPWNPNYDMAISDGVRRVQQFAFSGDW